MAGLKCAVVKAIASQSFAQGTKQGSRSGRRGGPPRHSYSQSKHAKPLRPAYKPLRSARLRRLSFGAAPREKLSLLAMSNGDAFKEDPQARMDAMDLGQVQVEESDCRPEPPLYSPASANSDASTQTPRFDFSVLESHPHSGRTSSAIEACINAAIGPELVVFSGGTAFNGVAKDLVQLTTRVTHVLPVSDDGGSTAEIVRVLGGPAVGDIRSRCLRLSDVASDEARAVRKLLSYRLDKLSQSAAKQQWYQIVEGEHVLWNGISSPYKDTIRGFLVHFHSQVIRHPTDAFNYCNGSVGNFFFAGARIFFRSLDAAIFLYSRVSGIPPESLVLPCINTTDRLTLGAELLDGTIIRGQNVISHPPADATGEVQGSASSTLVDKTSDGPALNSTIKRVFYLSSEGTHKTHEVYPAVHPAVLSKISGADGIVYGMGSLFTSICPSLVLKGVGEAISAREDCMKIMLLNGYPDRETGGMDALDFVMAVTTALNRGHSPEPQFSLDYPPSKYITHLLAPSETSIPVPAEKIEALGIKVMKLESTLLEDANAEKEAKCIFKSAALIHSLSSILSGEQ
mmetsp:Transcript_9640/g.35312  ORF Transcript_9640/g.35312 Transcript_9640/m.35312 type:complete len:570 (+) Transcript_9640:90-1799(+)